MRTESEGEGYKEWPSVIATAIILARDDDRSNWETAGGTMHVSGFLIPIK